MAYGKLDHCVIFQNPILTGSSKIVGKRICHNTCVKCSMCKSVLDKDDYGHVKANNFIICTPCNGRLKNPKCNKCLKPVENSYVKVGINNYHPACIRCSKSQKPLPPGLHKEKDGQIYCDESCVNLKTSTSLKDPNKSDPPMEKRAAVADQIKPTTTSMKDIEPPKPKPDPFLQLSREDIYGPPSKPPPKIEEKLEDVDQGKFKDEPQ